MDIEIHKLVPELANDYVNFFDVTPHDDNVNEHVGVMQTQELIA